MKKVCRLLIVVFSCVILSQTGWAQTAPTLNAVRYSVSKDIVRVVLDVEGSVDYIAGQDANNCSVTLDLPMVSAAVASEQIIVNDSAVTAIQVVASDDQMGVQVRVDSRLPIFYNVFSLNNPNRIVIDISKITEQKTETEIAAGVRHTSWYKFDEVGPVNIQVLAISPKSGFRLEPRLIRHERLGLDPLSQVERQGDVLAAVNGSYFSAGGSAIGILKINGELINSSELIRTAVGIKADGTLKIGQPHYRGMVTFASGDPLAITQINDARSDNSLAMYTAYYGTNTRTNEFGIEYIVNDGRVIGIQSSNSVIPATGFVISAHGDSRTKLASIRSGDSATVKHTLGTAWDEYSHVLSAGPMLVKDSNVYLTTKLEGFGNDVAGGRAPRTALGLTKDGKILLVVVDGRQPVSRGMTLLELALLMQELGADSAMNLDGGGSSEMIIKGRIMNRPSEGKERRVANALVVVRK